MGSVSEPPRGSVFGVRFPVFWEIISGDVGQPLLFCDLRSLEPQRHVERVSHGSGLRFAVCGCSGGCQSSGSWKPCGTSWSKRSSERRRRSTSSRASSFQSLRSRRSQRAISRTMAAACSVERVTVQRRAIASEAEATATATSAADVPAKKTRGAAAGAAARALGASRMNRP